MHYNVIGVAVKDKNPVRIGCKEIGLLNAAPNPIQEVGLSFDIRSLKWLFTA